MYVIPIMPHELEHNSSSVACDSPFYRIVASILPGPLKLILEVGRNFAFGSVFPEVQYSAHVSPYQQHL